jgi:N utilization substance protein A
MLPQIEAIIAKKQDGRPITPEEYHLMGGFVDRIEQGVIQRRQAIKQEHDLRLKNAQEAVPEAIFDLPVFALGLSKNVTRALKKEEYEFIGDLMVQFFFDSSKLIEIKGIGEKVLGKIQDAFDLLTSTLPEPEPEPEPEVIETVDEKAAAETEAEPPSEDTVAELEAEAVLEEPEPVEEEKEELPTPLEDIFKLKTEMLDLPEEGDELIEDISETKKKKQRRKKFVEQEYDPDQDVTIYRKKHKRDVDDWDKKWDL